MTNKEFCERYLVDRRNTAALKWDGLGKKFGDSDLIGMWVADSEFRVPDEVIDTVVKRVQHGAYGYTMVGDDYYNTVIKWNKEHYNADIKKEDIRMATAVMTSIYWIVNAFTKEGDSCAIMTPVYYPFTDAIVLNKRNRVACPLINDNGVYSIDFEGFEKRVVENNVKLYLHCSPHNPVGRVWTEEEMDRLFDICQRHNVLIVSDEIHQDIIIGDNPFVPAGNVAGGRYRDRLFTVNAASKSFNLACLNNSFVFIYNPELRKIFDEYAERTVRFTANLLGTTATKAAYDYGAEWLEGFVSVVKANYQYAKERLNKEAPEIIISELQGTYLMWLDLRAYVSPEHTREFAQNKCRLGVDYGEWFGDDNYKGFIRINLATDPAFVKTAVDNIVKNLPTK